MKGNYKTSKFKYTTKRVSNKAAQANREKKYGKSIKKRICKLTQTLNNQGCSKNKGRGSTNY